VEYMDGVVGSHSVLGEAKTKRFVSGYLSFVVGPLMLLVTLLGY